ncbi:MAG: YbjN domain-containing protein [Selenomonadaceae bacterium]|nr:YbjN domain-containing protein [Selenomonadaceae bacterium]
MPKKGEKKEKAETENQEVTPEAAEPKEKKSSKKKGVESNAKALKFQEFLMDNDIRAFSTESIDDEYQTVIFRSRLEAKGQQLPMAIYIDMGIFTVIRVQVATGMAGDRLARIGEYLNTLNARYKIFKYYLRENGSVNIDVCLPFTDETFDAEMIRLMLNILVRHLEENYEEFMEHVWAK